jgi:Bacterial extracellular solute-binding protein
MMMKTGMMIVGAGPGSRQDRPRHHTAGDRISGTDWNDFFAKVLTQIAAGTPPDIVGVATEGVQLMASKGLAIPLDDYVKKDMESLKEAAILHCGHHRRRVSIAVASADISLLLRRTR